MWGFLAANNRVKWTLYVDYRPNHRNGTLMGFDTQYSAEAST